MAALAMPALPYLLTRPERLTFVSASPSDGWAWSMVDWADARWQARVRATMRTASHLMLFEGWATDLVRQGQQSVVFVPTDHCVPQAYWGNPTAPAILNTGALDEVQFGKRLVVNSVTNGLHLQAGDRIGFLSGDFRSLHTVNVGAIASGGSITFWVNENIPSYIPIGATVVFAKPSLNMVVVPGSISMPSELRPTVEFTLLEVPK